MQPLPTITVEQISEECDKFLEALEAEHGKKFADLLQSLITLRSYMIIMHQLLSESESPQAAKAISLTKDILAFTLSMRAETLELSEEDQTEAIKQADIFYALLERKVFPEAAEH